MTQTYGIPTYDGLFKYILSDDSIRPSFFHAFIPDLHIESSQRLDDHMNPLAQEQLHEGPRYSDGMALIPS